MNPSEAAYVSGRSGQAHLLLVSYLSAPTDLPPARRTKALGDAFEELGVRVTVLTSTVSGEASSGNGGTVRAGDLRARVAGPDRVLARPGMRVVPSSNRRRWTRVVVPDVTGASWAPAAILEAARIARRDRPNGVFTVSPPESAHLVGLALRAFRVPWIADLRDGWTFESPTPRPYLGFLDRALERQVVRRADLVTAVTRPLAEQLRRVAGAHTRVVELANGFDPRSVDQASDERGELDPTRFTLVYTGTGRLDGKDPLPFLRALRRLLEERPALRQRLEVLFAGNFVEEEAEAMRSPDLAGVTKFVGRLEHTRALGLQRAADGLLLITSCEVRSVATGKLYEYLAACKPILALAERNAAAELLARAGAHVTAPPDDEERILDALRSYADIWVENGATYAHDPGFDVSEYAFPRVACRLLDLFVEIGALRRA